MEDKNEEGRNTFYGSISAINSFNGTNTSRLEDKFSKMKRVIATIESYLLTRSDDQAVAINQYLQALSLSLDLSIFDPHTNVASKFYISLFDLMNNLEPRSVTCWYVVDVLLNACKNSSARQALLNTYQFLPCLSRMAGDQISTDKKTRLLRLMQDITCGIKIYWQIPHLTHLLTTLCKWIERQEPDVTLCLGVLVNLCYKNVSSLYILQRHVDLKKFIRMCLALKGPIAEVYVCQVTILLENVSGYIPPVVFFKLIDSTFTAAIEAYKKQDSTILKQVVEFFTEHVETNSSNLSGYEKYAERVDCVLDLIAASKDKSGDPECLAIILEFINFLIEAKVPQISSLYSKIIPLALSWIQTSIVSYQALAVLRGIAVNVDKKDNIILESLIVGLKVFLLILNSYKDERVMIDTDYNKRLGALLQLLTAMIQVKSISSKVTNELHEDMFTAIFSPLLGDDSPRSNEITCSPDAINLYIYTLDLLTKLVECNQSWIGFLNGLLGNRQIHVIIAQAICLSPATVKKLALKLSSSCCNGVSLALCNLQSIMATGNDGSSHIASPQQNDLTCNLITVGQHERLQNLIENIEGLISRNEINNLATSEVIELYNYKLSYVSRGERDAVRSAEAVTNYCATLKQKISRLTYEQSQLLQSDFHKIQKLEEALRTKEELKVELKELRIKFEAEKGKYKALHSQFTMKEKLLTENIAALAETEGKLTKLQQLFNKVEENCRRHEKNEQKKEEALKKANESIANYVLQVKELEASMAEKQRLLQDTTAALTLKTSILDSITKMANSQGIK